MRCCFDGATGAAHHEMESVQVLSSIITVISTNMVIIIITIIIIIIGMIILVVSTGAGSVEQS